MAQLGLPCLAAKPRRRGEHTFCFSSELHGTGTTLVLVESHEIRSQDCSGLLELPIDTALSPAQVLNHLKKEKEKKKRENKIEAEMFPLWPIKSR